jgi:DNA-binding transcriptional LysR family regulator
VNDRQLRTFITCAETNSFSKAAKVSYISTPALIQQIDSLESNLGFPLFERKRQGILLTPAGDQFLKTARQIVSLYDEACISCKEMDTHHKGDVKIVCSANQIPGFLLDAVADFTKANPQCNTSFVYQPYNDHIQTITEGDADFSILAEPAAQYLDKLFFTPLMTETYSFCMRKDHPLAGLDLITEDDLKDAQIMCGYYPYLKQSFEQHLPTENTTLLPINSEYDMQVRMRSFLGNEIFAIHSLWRNNYTSILAVVPSNIPAGDIGILYRDIRSVQTILPYLEKQIRKYTEIEEQG